MCFAALVTVASSWLYFGALQSDKERTDFRPIITFPPESLKGFNYL